MNVRRSQLLGHIYLILIGRTLLYQQKTISSHLIFKLGPVMAMLDENDV